MTEGLGSVARDMQLLHTSDNLLDSLIYTIEGQNERKGGKLGTEDERGRDAVLQRN